MGCAGLRTPANPGGWLRTSMPARHWTVGTVRDGDFVESSAHLKGKLGYLVTLGR